MHSEPQSSKPVRQSPWFALLRRYPTLLIGLTVLLILHGPSGTFSVLRTTGSEFVQVCLGDNEDGNPIADVLWRTAPLALSAAVIGFAVARRWIVLESTGILLCAVIILAGAWIGNELNHNGTTIEPLMPDLKVGGALGVVAGAVNQLFGYLVHYQLRLFAAALLVGGYLGWQWHRNLTDLENWLAARKSAPVVSSHKPSKPRRRAA